MTPSTMSRTATISCRPSTRRVAVPAAKLVTRAIIFCTRAVKVTISIRNMGMYRVQPVRPVVFRNTARAISTRAARSWLAEPNRGHTLL